MLYEAKDDIYAETGTEDKRNQVLLEIAKTEKNYVDVLTVLIEKFEKPLAARKALTPEESAQIFSNIHFLLGVHAKLYADIQKAMSSTTGRHVSGPMIKHIPNMRYAIFRTR